ncbi:MAG: ankyrin repeat domain-containing protein [Planctomycetes bacterium]|nr:ankyrin repeat domain-containing protein [Planctomycetota bacterium]
MTILNRFAACILAALFSASPLPAAEFDARLVEAAQRGDEATVAELLKRGANADAAAPDGATVLHWAAHLDKLRMAERLIRAGADVNAVNRYGIKPLMPACTNGNAGMVGLLLEAGADPNAATPDGETVLMIAARTGKPESVHALLSHGAKPNLRENWRGQTALMWAAAEGHVTTLETLIKAGANRETRSKGGFTAFLFAVRQGRIGVVRSLRTAGADVNQRLSSNARRRRAASAQRYGITALGLAVANAHYELAALLLDAGADPNATWQGRGLLHTMTWVRKPGAGSNDPPPPGSGNMTSLELVRKLVKHGVNVNARMQARGGGARTSLNMRGATPFLLAARTADAELMRLLADLGADPLLPNADKSTPLMVAAGLGVRSPGEDPGTESEVAEAVTLALELGNDVNAVDNLGNTALHGAAYKHLASIVSLLVKNGADVKIWNQKNKQGWTPLRIATGVHRGMNFRSSPKTAATIRKVMIAAGVSTVLEPETNISGATR